MAGRIRTPLLDQLRGGKKSDDLLIPVVEDWLVKNANKVDKYNEEEFEVLKDLMIRGAVRNMKMFSPSGATNCRRRQVIDKMGFKPLLIKDPKLLRIFSDGTWRHLRWQMLFYKMGIAESMEVFASIGGEGSYGGSYDVICNLKMRLKNKTQQVLVDIKGTNASRFNDIKFTGKPIYSNKVQVVIYMYLNDIDVGIIWYENKNTQDLCEVVIRRDKNFDRILSKYLYRQEYMARYVRAGVFPKEECDIDGGDSMFKGCAQRNACRCLPIHLIGRNGRVAKVHEPRRISLEEMFVERNTSPLRKLKGFRIARRTRSRP